MTKEDFKRKFIGLIKRLFLMQHVSIYQLCVPNGECLSISVKNGICRLECYRGSFRIYRFYHDKNIDDFLDEKLDHIGFLSAYLYNTNESNKDKKKILDGLRLEAVNQI